MKKVYPMDAMASKMIRTGETERVYSFGSRCNIIVDQRSTHRQLLGAILGFAEDMVLGNVTDIQIDRVAKRFGVSKAIKKSLIRHAKKTLAA